MKLPGAARLGRRVIHRNASPSTVARGGPLVALLALALAAIPVAARGDTAPTTPGLFVHDDESVAHPDGALAGLFNPAAAGVRYPSELSMLMVDPSVGRETYRLAMLARGVTVSASGADDRHLLFGTAFAGGSERFRLGLATDWFPKSGGGRVSDYRLGALSRPLPWLSLGGVVTHLGTPRMAGVRLDREYTAGIGIRPLALVKSQAHSWGTRFTLTADARMKGGERAADARVRLGAEIGPMDGLVLRGSVDPDQRSFRLGVSLMGARSGYHGASRYQRDRDRIETTHAVSFHGAEDRSALSRPRNRRVATIRVGGDLGDDALSGFSIFGAQRTATVAPLHRELERALEDPLTRGVLLEVSGVSNMAQIEELRPRIARLRAAGKPVVAYLESGGGRGSFYLASACDRIVAGPEAFFYGLGLRAERRYYRQLLADWGIRIDRTSNGKYKSAFRNYSVDSTSDADREVIEHNLDALQELFVASVAADRKLERERLLTLLDGRRWPPTELAKAGLIDSVGYREDALRILGRACGLGERPRAERLSRHPQAQVEWTVPSRIAVVYATGSIESGRSGNDLFLGPFMGSETMVAQIESAFRRRDVEAVVLRVESGGGSSVASDLIHHATARMKRSTKKPLVVSMGGAAASGGYHISLAADRIFADRFTRTGSIGVVFVRGSLEGWYAKHGVRQDAFERGDHMRGWSQGRDWDAEIQASADSANLHEYQGFVSTVAAARGLTDAEAERAAQGRVWLGEDALRLKLVDEIGGLEQAIAEARRRAGIPEGEKIRPIEYRRPRPGLVQRLVGSMAREAIEEHVRLPDPGTALYWAGEDLR